MRSVEMQALFHTIVFNSFLYFGTGIILKSNWFTIMFYEPYQLHTHLSIAFLTHPWS